VRHPESAFEMPQDVPAGAQPYTADTIAAYAELVFPAVEIVDHRFADWRAFDANTLIADNALRGFWRLRPG
jgi:2-keto-4-pentenoate hydratase